MSFGTEVSEVLAKPERSELLTTREAAELTGRSQDSVKCGLRYGRLRGERVDGFWYIRRDDLVAWNAASSPRRMPPRQPPQQKAAEALAEYRSVTPAELATLLGVHPGNARKYLALLAAEDRAHRHADGQWFPGPVCDEQEEAAS